MISATRRAETARVAATGRAATAGRAERANMVGWIGGGERRRMEGSWREVELELTCGKRERGQREKKTPTENFFRSRSQRNSFPPLCVSPRPWLAGRRETRDGWSLTSEKTAPTFQAGIGRSERESERRRRGSEESEGERTIDLRRPLPLSPPPAPPRQRLSLFLSFSLSPPACLAVSLSLFLTIPI